MGEMESAAVKLRARLFDPWAENKEPPAGSRGSTLDVLSLQSLVAFHHIELDDFTLIQGFETLTEDRGVMHKDILTGFLDDKAEALLVVEPLDLAAGHKLSPD
jgi:hypothetical protein